jgi:hypothetical protein
MQPYRYEKHRTAQEVKASKQVKASKLATRRERQGQEATQRHTVASYVCGRQLATTKYVRTTVVGKRGETGVCGLLATVKHQAWTRNYSVVLAAIATCQRSPGEYRRRSCSPPRPAWWWPSQAAHMDLVFGLAVKDQCLFTNSKRLVWTFLGASLRCAPPPVDCKIFAPELIVFEKYICHRVQLDEGFSEMLVFSS